MNETLIRGDVNELQCILDFQKRGYYCSVPFSGSCRYDVVVDINNHLYRIQCKSSVFSETEGVLKIDATRKTTNTQKTVSYTYSKEEIDYFYTSWKNYSFLIPVEEVSTIKCLRVKTPSKGIQSSMSIASDYLIDKVITAIKSNSEIEKYANNNIISWTDTESEKLWSKKELEAKYNERQIKHIKECIKKKKMGYNYYWKYKEFPVL